jgi:hypothetical protein
MGMDPYFRLLVIASMIVMRSDHLCRSPPGLSAGSVSVSASWTLPCFYIQTKRILTVLILPQVCQIRGVCLSDLAIGCQQGFQVRGGAPTSARPVSAVVAGIYDYRRGLRLCHCLTYVPRWSQYGVSGACSVEILR